MNDCTKIIVIYTQYINLVKLMYIETLNNYCILCFTRIYFFDENKIKSY